MRRRDKSRQIRGSRGQKPSARFLKQAAPDHITSRAMLDSIILVILARNSDFIKTSSTSRINFLAHLHNVSPAPSVGLLPFFNLLIWSLPRVLDMGWRALVRLRGLCSATVPTSNMLMMRNLLLTMIISVVACREELLGQNGHYRFPSSLHSMATITPLLLRLLCTQYRAETKTINMRVTRWKSVIPKYLNAERHRRLLDCIDKFPWCFS